MKKKETTGGWPAKPGQPRKTVTMNDGQNPPEARGEGITSHHMEQKNYRGYTARCKHLISKNHQARIISKKYKDEPEHFCNKCVWMDETKAFTKAMESWTHGERKEPWFNHQNFIFLLWSTYPMKRPHNNTHNSFSFESMADTAIRRSGHSLQLHCCPETIKISQHMYILLLWSE